LAFNEKGLRKLELYENYREKLSDPSIMDSFKAILSKVKTIKRVNQRIFVCFLAKEKHEK